MSNLIALERERGSSGEMHHEITINGGHWNRLQPLLETDLAGLVDILKVPGERERMAFAPLGTARWWKLQREVLTLIAQTVVNRNLGLQQMG